MDLKQKAVTGVVWSAVQNWGSQLITLTVFIVLARLLEPESFGLIALAMAFIGFFQVFINSGFPSAIIQRKELEPEHLDAAFWASMGIGIVLLCLSLISSSYIAKVFDEPKLGTVLTLLSFLLVLLPQVAIQTAILRRRLEFRSLAIRTISAEFAGGVVGIYMAVNGYGVLSLVAKVLTSSIISVIVLWKVSTWRPRIAFSSRHFCDIFSFGINVTGIGLTDYVSKRFDNVLIGYFLGTTELGYYNLAYRVMTILKNVITGTVKNVALPIFSKLQADKERRENAFYRVTQFTGMIAIPVFSGLSIIAPEFIPAIFGEKWTDSIPVMQVLALIGIVISISQFNGTVLVAAGKPGWKLAFSTVSMCINIAVFMVVVKWGIVAVATAFVVTGYILFPIELILVRRAIQIRLMRYFTFLKPIIIATMFMVVSIVWIKQVVNLDIGVYWGIASNVLSGIFVYSMVLFFVSPGLVLELRDLFRVALKKKKSK